MTVDVTPEVMEACADAAFLLDRAAGAPMPNDPFVVDVYKVGFAAGATWALSVIRAEEA